MILYGIYLTLSLFIALEAAVSCDQFSHPELLQPLSTELQTRIQYLADKLEIKQQICAFFITPERLNSPALMWQSLSQAYASDSAYLLIQRKKFEKFTDEEQLFILYHELSHIKRNHACSRYTWNFISYAAAVACGYGAYKLSRHHQDPLSLKLASTAAGTYAGWLVCNLISCKKARERELQADKDALEWQQNKDAALSALKKTIHLTMPKKSFLRRLFEHHPSIEERIRNLS